MRFSVEARTPLASLEPWTCGGIHLSWMLFIKRRPPLRSCLRLTAAVPQLKSGGKVIKGSGWTIDNFQVYLHATHKHSDALPILSINSAVQNLV